MFDIFNNAIFSINNSKMFAGLIMIVINIGSRYISFGFSKSQEEFLKSIAREILIFAFVWMATHDVYTSIIMTIVFVIIIDYILNENSRFCLLPEKYKQFSKLVDVNNDGIVTENEINQAMEILRKAKMQQNKLNQLNMMSYLHNNVH